MDVSDMQVSDDDGCSTRSNTIKGNNKIVKERIWINPVISEITFQPLYSDTEASIARGACDFQYANKQNLHIGFYRRDVPDRMRTTRKLPVDVMLKSFQEVIKVQIQTSTLMSSPLLQLSGQRD